MRKPVLVNCKKCEKQFKRRRVSNVFCSRSCARIFIGTPKGVVNRGSFKKQVSPWNKGLKNWRAGYRHSDKTLSLLRRPKSKPEYKTPEDERIRKRFSYKAWREVIVQRDVVCQSCGSENNLHAHHIITVKAAPLLATDTNNGILLCGACHAKAHGFGQFRKKFTNQRAVKLG